jgi:hypothetical protein
MLCWPNPSLPVPLPLFLRQKPPSFGKLKDCKECIEEGMLIQSRYLTKKVRNAGGGRSLNGQVDHRVDAAPTIPDILPWAFRRRQTFRQQGQLFRRRHRQRSGEVSI